MYNEYINTDSPEQVLNRLWDMFSSDPENTKYIPNKDLFILSLFSKKNSVGAIDLTTITYLSNPVYDTWSNWWNNIKAWNCTVWKDWYIKNVNQLGKASANLKFANAWTEPNNWSIGSNAFDCCNDCDIVQFYANNGVDIRCTGTALLCNIQNLAGNIVNATSQTASVTYKTTKLVNDYFPYIVIGGLAYFGYNFLKKNNK